jgi:hypothetical protein
LTHQIHHVPGRLRIRVPAIKRSGENAALLKELLRAVQGVYEAEPNLMTGSIVVRYDPQFTSAVAIVTILTDRGYLRHTPFAPLDSTVAVRISGKVAKAVFWYCLEKALERSVPLMLSALL